MFITFEGIEGAGKGTVIRKLQEWLKGMSPEVLITREPGGSELGRYLRAYLLDARQKIEDRAELFLYLADRAQHVRQVIRPVLSRGGLVISDRFADSTIVYQGYGRGLDIDQVYSLNQFAVGSCWPDRTFLLDVDPEIGLERARQRNQAEGLEILEGRFEAEKIAFHRRVREGYLDWAGKYPARFRIINAMEPPEEVFKAVRHEIQAMFPQAGSAS